MCQSAWESEARKTERLRDSFKPTPLSTSPSSPQATGNSDGHQDTSASAKGPRVPAGEEPAQNSQPGGQQLRTRTGPQTRGPTRGDGVSLPRPGGVPPAPEPAVSVRVLWRPAGGVPTDRALSGPNPGSFTPERCSLRKSLALCLSFPLKTGRNNGAAPHGGAVIPAKGLEQGLATVRITPERHGHGCVCPRATRRPGSQSVTPGPAATFSKVHVTLPGPVTDAATALVEDTLPACPRVRPRRAGPDLLVSDARGGEGEGGQREGPGSTGRWFRNSPGDGRPSTGTGVSGAAEPCRVPGGHRTRRGTALESA